MAQIRPAAAYLRSSYLTDEHQAGTESAKTSAGVANLDRDYWQRVVSFEALAEQGVIDGRDLGLFEFVETAEQAWALVEARYAGEA